MIPSAKHRRKGTTATRNIWSENAERLIDDKNEYPVYSIVRATEAWSAIHGLSRFSSAADSFKVRCDSSPVLYRRGTAVIRFWANLKLVRNGPPVSRFLGRPSTHVSRASRCPRVPREFFLIRFSSPPVCVAAARCFLPPCPPPRSSPNRTTGRSFKMQTRGPWGFKTPAIPGFR